MDSGNEDRQARDRMQAQLEMVRCQWLSSSFQVLGFVLAAVGVIAAALDRSVVFAAQTWFLLAIFASLNAVVPTLNLLSVRHRLAEDLPKQ